MARKGNPISVRLGLNRSSSSSWFSESDRGSIRIFLSLYLTRLFCTAILLISMYLLISFLGSGDSFHLLLEKVGFSLGGRALSGTLRLLGCSAGLAFTVGFALRCLLTGEDWGAHMMLPSGEGTSSSANYNESFFIDVLLEGRPTGTETESVETGTSVNQAESGRLPPANQVAPRGDEAGPSNQPPQEVSLQPEDPFSYTPLIPDETRWQELNDRLGINSIARPIDLEVRDKIVDTQVLIEKKIEKALLSDGYSPQEILRERHKIRANLFYPHGAPLSMRTYQQYRNLMEKHGTHRTGPYCRLAEAIYQGDISLGEDPFSLYKKRRFF